MTSSFVVQNELEPNEHPESEAFVRYSIARQAEFETGARAVAQIKGLLGRWLRGWTDDRKDSSIDEWIQAGLSTEVNSIPRLAHSLNRDCAT